VDEPNGKRGKSIKTRLIAKEKTVRDARRKKRVGKRFPIDD
jgi:hypothetical protein